jgi:hypothetical protein
MPRAHSPSALVSLPTLDAPSALALASSLEAAAKGDKKHPPKLTEPVAESLDDLTAARAALQTALAGAPAVERLTPKEADRDEDTAVGAPYAILTAWARLAGVLPEGDTAQRLLARLFPEGIELVNFKVEREWAAVDTILKTIHAEALDASLASLGLAPAIDHLKKVHARYGEAIGVTKPLPAAERPEVRESLDALAAAIRQYVVAVSGSVIRSKPATQALADALLRPLAEWRSDPPKARAPTGALPAQPPEAPATGAPVG